MKTGVFGSEIKSDTAGYNLAELVLSSSENPVSYSKLPRLVLVNPVVIFNWKPSFASSTLYMVFWENSTSKYSITAPLGIRIKPSVSCPVAASISISL